MNIIDPAKVGIPDTPPNMFIGIRAEHITVSESGFALAVDLIEPLGSETLIHGMLVGGQRLTLRRAGPPPDQSTLTISLPVGALHYFDALTGERVLR